MMMICHKSFMRATGECDTSWASGTNHLTEFCVLSVKTQAIIYNIGLHAKDRREYTLHFHCFFRIPVPERVHGRLSKCVALVAVCESE